MHSLLPQLNLGAAPLQKGTASQPAKTPEGAAPRQIDASFEEVMLADAGPSHLDDASQPDTPLTDQAPEEAAPKQQSPDVISDDVDVAQTVDDQSSPGASRHVSKAEPTNFPAFPQENASSFKEEKIKNSPTLPQRMSTIAVDSPDQSVNDRPAAETGAVRHRTTELARAEFGVSATTTPERGRIPSPADTMDASPPIPGRAKPGNLPSQSVEQAVGPSPPPAFATTQREGTVPAHANAQRGHYDKLAVGTKLDAAGHRFPTPGVRPSSDSDPLKAPDAPALSSGFADRTITAKDVQTRVADPLPELKKTPVTPVPSRDSTAANRPVSEAIALAASPAPRTDKPARAGQTNSQTPDLAQPEFPKAAHENGHPIMGPSNDAAAPVHPGPERRELMTAPFAKTHSTDQPGDSPQTRIAKLPLRTPDEILPTNVQQSERHTRTEIAATLMARAENRNIAPPDDVTPVQQVIRLKGEGPIPRADTELIERPAASPSRQPLAAQQTPAMTPPIVRVDRIDPPPDLGWITHGESSPRTDIARDQSRPIPSGGLESIKSPPMLEPAKALEQSDPERPISRVSERAEIAAVAGARPATASAAPQPLPIAGGLGIAQPHRTNPRGAEKIDTTAPIVRAPADVRSTGEKTISRSLAETPTPPLVPSNVRQVAGDRTTRFDWHRHQPTGYPPTKSAPSVPAATKPAEPIKPTVQDTAQVERTGPGGALPLRSDPLAPAPPPQSAPTRMDLPTHVARQIVEVAQHLPGRPIEISLSPEELGRVRLSVSPTEAGLTVHVAADRPETLDLMRRHIQTLAQEFGAIGYGDVAFSFSSGSNPTSSTAAQDDPEQAITDLPPDLATLKKPTTQRTSAEGLDLRL